MSAVNFSVREFYDQSTEYIGIKSGLLLDRNTLRRVLQEKFDDSFLEKDNLTHFIRLRVEEIEDMFCHVRKRIGNLPSESAMANNLRIIHSYFVNKGNPMALATITSTAFRYFDDREDIDVRKIADEIARRERLPKEVALAVAEYGFERFDQSCLMPENKRLNIATDLSNLFDREVIPNSEFLEQKFIDYLAVNGHEIENIHWRNFERFCAQYFKKQGYIVELGPGGNDEGVDIRVFEETKTASSKPYILIQCKRYKSEHKVSIETVKSFYTDVHYEEAKSGLIATSSFIAPGGKKVSEVRGYNLSFAESDKVKGWAHKMWKYHK
ncbi:MAG TPA: restriction endonuclease [Mucilaginibacter sp.]|nr:restriction endonuclease [Mucilaginibacter sp.]